ncbi:hypothetical protein Droror1_Dr00028281 [Drosera rotundifolia]
MVEHSLAKAEVEGSSPSFRSRLRRLVVFVNDESRSLTPEPSGQVLSSMLSLLTRVDKEGGLGPGSARNRPSLESYGKAMNKSELFNISAVQED